MTTGQPPNYYAILDVHETASTQQIRDAYKRAALKTHPDRVPVDSPERASRTRKFQLVNDAYFTLSDTARRREYDSQRRLFGGGGGGFGFEGFGGGRDSPPTTSAGADPFAETGSPQPAPSQSAYSWAWNFFTGNGGQKQQQQQQEGDARQNAENEQFGDVFEEMLREEGLADNNGTANSRFWGLLGGASGASLGFIVANVPGLVAGAVAGNRLGAIRDAKGKSVYEVFQELPQSDRARLLSQLAAKVFSHAVGS